MIDWLMNWVLRTNKKEIIEPEKDEGPPPPLCLNCGSILDEDDLGPECSDCTWQRFVESAEEKRHSDYINAISYKYAVEGAPRLLHGVNHDPNAQLDYIIKMQPRIEEFLRDLNYEQLTAFQQLEEEKLIRVVFAFDWAPLIYLSSKDLAIDAKVDIDGMVKAHSAYLRFGPVGVEAVCHLLNNTTKTKPEEEFQIAYGKLRKMHEQRK